MNTTIAVGVWTTPAFPRLVRGRTLALRQREYVLAARALGAAAPWLLWRHVLPNVVAPLVMFASVYMANAVLLEAALGFLGLWVRPPQPS